jgi:hypothetical protein
MYIGQVSIVREFDTQSQPHCSHLVECLTALQSRAIAVANIIIVGTAVKSFSDIDVTQLSFSGTNVIATIANSCRQQCIRLANTPMGIG